MASTQELSDFSNELVTVLEQKNEAQNEAKNALTNSVRIESTISKELSVLEDKAEVIRKKIETLTIEKHAVDAQVKEKKAVKEKSAADTADAKITFDIACAESKKARANINKILETLSPAHARKTFRFILFCLFLPVSQS